MNDNTRRIRVATRALRRPINSVDVGGMRSRYYVGLDAQIYYQHNDQLAGTAKKDRHHRSIMYKGKFYTTYQVLQLFDLMGIPPLHHIIEPSV